MSGDGPVELTPIGRVESPLTDLSVAPKQGDEGAPEAWLAIDPEFAEALAGIDAGDELLVLTWLHRGQRDVLRVHPRGRLRVRNLEAVHGTPVLDLKPVLSEDAGRR